MPKVICIGSVAKDIFYPICDGLVMETPEDITAKRKIAFELGAKYLVDDSFEALGGGAANVSVGLAKLGIESVACGRIGNDEIGRWIREELISNGVSDGLIQADKDGRSDSSLILAHGPTKDRIIFYNRDANENLAIEQEALRSEYFFVSSLSGNLGNSWEDKLKLILDTVEREKVRLVLNPGQRNIAEGHELIIEAVAISEILILNKDEAIGIVLAANPSVTQSELDSETSLIEQLKGMGPEIVVLTDGCRGAWVGGHGKIFYAEPLDLGVIDTTGAGDAFSSAFLAASIKGLGPDKALAWGIINSASVVRYYGSHEGLLSETEIMDRLDGVSLKELT